MVAYEYDYRLWMKMSDQLEKGSKSLNPQHDLSELNQKVMMQVETKFSKKPSVQARADNRGSDGSKQTQKDPPAEVCSYCGKPGHTEKFCFQKIKAKRQAAFPSRGTSKNNLKGKGKGGGKSNFPKGGRR